jgi:hypothetical protein
MEESMYSTQGQGKNGEGRGGRGSKAQEKTAAAALKTVTCPYPASTIRLLIGSVLIACAKLPAFIGQTEEKRQSKKRDSAYVPQQLFIIDCEGVVEERLGIAIGRLALGNLLLGPLLQVVVLLARERRRVVCLP